MPEVQVEPEEMGSYGDLWEGMEAFYDMTGDPIGTIEYYIDTVKDLFNDVFGAIVGYLVLRK